MLEAREVEIDSADDRMDDGDTSRTHAATDVTIELHFQAQLSNRRHKKALVAQSCRPSPGRLE